jgi:hypothetical protein
MTAYKRRFFTTEGTPHRGPLEKGHEGREGFDIALAPDLPDYPDYQRKSGQSGAEKQVTDKKRLYRAGYLLY